MPQFFEEDMGGRRASETRNRDSLVSFGRQDTGKSDFFRSAPEVDDDDTDDLAQPAPASRSFGNMARNYLSTFGSRAAHAGGWGALMGRGYKRMDQANAKRQAFHDQLARGRASYARRWGQRDRAESSVTSLEPMSAAPSASERMGELQQDHGYDSADVQRWESQPGLDESLNPFGKFRPGAGKKPRRSVRGNLGNW